jgi:hypothetical protein
MNTIFTKRVPSFYNGINALVELFPGLMFKSTNEGDVLKELLYEAANHFGGNSLTRSGQRLVVDDGNLLYRNQDGDIFGWALAQGTTVHRYTFFIITQDEDKQSLAFRNGWTESAYGTPDWIDPVFDKVHSGQ